MNTNENRSKIVLVDDNITNLEIGRDMLRDYYEVYPADSAEKLFEILENVSPLPKLILLDVKMPEMNGFEAIKILKANSRFQEIPVIFLTVKNDEESELEGLSLGAIDYIHKPFSAPLLLKRIENHLEKRQSDEASRFKSSFLAGMSHEIRTPMNAIIGMTELLLHEPLNAHQMGFVNDIHASAHSLLSIINDILDLSKIETGKLELIPVNYDFHLFTGNIVSMITYLAEKKGIDFKFEQDGELPAYLYGDEIRLKQVLVNICGNAVKFTDRGGVCLYVSASENTVKFEITDTGKGIRKEDIPKLFDVYEQSDTLRNRAVVGTGLGLAICKSFVEMMNGEIKADSVKGHGSVFTITVPLVPGQKQEAENNIQSKEKSIIAPAADILVVDDNEFNLKVASGLLGLHKIKAQTALSGKEAIELVQKYDFDIVFMDHMMPHMDGVQATDIIRKLGGKYRLLPIIALTANTVKGAREMFLSHGLNGFIGKPIDTSELNKILTEWLPPEKLTELSESENLLYKNKSERLENNLLDSISKIKEINVEIGLKRFSGIEELYLDTLKNFCLALLPKCSKMQTFIDNEDLSNFAIAVHGMKSELATIGAMRLSEIAFKLESAAKNKEGEACAAQYPVLKNNLIQLQEQISAVFPISEETTDKPQGNQAFLNEKIKAALTAADDFDTDSGAEIINSLLAYSYGETINALLAEALTAFKNFNCDDAAVVLKQIN